MAKPDRVKFFNGVEALIANDREPGEDRDAWKYKLLNPDGPWSPPFDDYVAAWNAAVRDSE